MKYHIVNLFLRRKISVLLGFMSCHTFLNFLWRILAVLNLYELNLSLSTMHIWRGGTHMRQWFLFILLDVVWTETLGDDLRLSVWAELSTDTSSLNSWVHISVTRGQFFPCLCEKGRLKACQNPEERLESICPPNFYIHYLLVFLLVECIPPLVKQRESGFVAGTFLAR